MKIKNRKMKKTLTLAILTFAAISTILGITNSHRNEESIKAQIMQNTDDISTIPVKDLSITVCFDNNPYDERLKTSWGFSCLIRGTEKTILFDTGGDGSILSANMKTLSIDPEEIDIVVLSHIHGDHVGGLNSFLEKNPEVVVYLPESFPKGFKDEVKKYGAEVVEIQEPVKICKGVYSTGELGTHIIEQSLFLNTEKGLIVVTGCAHPGIVKIINKAKDIINNDVLLVIGGFHLSGNSKGEIKNIISGFRNLGVFYACPTHCSGDMARQLFKDEYGENYINVGVGRVITVDSL